MAERKVRLEPNVQYQWVVALAPGVVLHPSAQARAAPPRSIEPGPELAPLVERHWLLSWDLPAQQHFPGSLVPQLSHNLTHEVGSGRPGIPDDAVVVADRRGRIAYVNPAIHALLGHRPEALVGQPLTVLMPERLRHGHGTGFARYAATAAG